MSALKIFHTVKELEVLGEEVNMFVRENDVDKLISVSDTCTTDEHGENIGVIRVVAYKESKSKDKIKEEL